MNAVQCPQNMGDMPRGLGKMLWKEKLELAAERVRHFENMNQARLETMFKVGSDWTLEDNDFPARDDKLNNIWSRCKQVSLF